MPRSTRAFIFTFATFALINVHHLDAFSDGDGCIVKKQKTKDSQPCVDWDMYTTCIPSSLEMPARLSTGNLDGKEWCATKNYDPESFDKQLNWGVCFPEGHPTAEFTVPRACLFQMGEPTTSSPSKPNQVTTEVPTTAPVMDPSLTNSPTTIDGETLSPVGTSVPTSAPSVGPSAATSPPSPLDTLVPTSMPSADPTASPLPNNQSDTAAPTPSPGNLSDTAAPTPSPGNLSDTVAPSPSPGNLSDTAAPSPSPGNVSGTAEPTPSPRGTPPPFTQAPTVIGSGAQRSMGPSMVFGIVLGLALGMVLV